MSTFVRVASLIALLVVPAGCSSSDRTLRAIPTPPAEEREGCTEHTPTHTWTIPGFPASKYFEVSRLSSEMCLHNIEDLEHHEGPIYVAAAEWNNAGLDLIEWADIWVDGKRVMWVRSGRPGWDPNFDYAPHVHYRESKDDPDQRTACTALKFSAGFYIPKTKTVIKVTPTYEACPPKD